MVLRAQALAGGKPRAPCSPARGTRAAGQPVARLVRAPAGCCGPGPGTCAL